jgi:hypothetical protein
LGQVQQEEFLQQFEILEEDAVSETHLGQHKNMEQ